MDVSTFSQEILEVDKSKKQLKKPSFLESNSVMSSWMFIYLEDHLRDMMTKGIFGDDVSEHVEKVDAKGLSMQTRVVEKDLFQQ